MKFLTNDDILNIFNNEIPLVGVLISDSSAYREVAEILKEDLFYFEANKIIFNAIKNISEEKPNYDISIVYNYLIQNNLINKINFQNYRGNEYLDYLSENVGYKKDLNNYLDILIPYAKKIKLTKLIEETSKQISQNQDINNVINNLQINLINMDISENSSQYEIIHEVASQSIDLIRKRAGNRITTGLNFGFEPLDDLTLGFNPGDLIILAARPSMGKTAFALNIAANVAKQKKTVLFFSLEMTNVQLVERIIGFESMISLSRLRSGNIEPEQWKEIDYTWDKIKNWDMFLNDKSSLNINDFLTLCRRFNQTKKIDLLIVDYLQLINDTKNSGDNRQLEVSKISRSLKQLAKELQCPVLALSQLSRRVETREDKQPVLSDLRESGTIEQDADSVIFLYRPDYYNKKTESTQQNNQSNNINTEWDINQPETNVSTTHVIVAKNRNGATGFVKLGFISEINKFIYEDKKYFGE